MDIELAQMTLPFSEQSDGDFLVSIRWASSGQRKNSRAAANGDVQEFSQQLKVDLASVSRSIRKQIERRNSRQIVMALWSAPGFDASERCAELAHIAGQLAVLSLGKKGKKATTSKKGQQSIDEYSSDLQVWLEECFSPADCSPLEWLILFEVLVIANSILSDELRFQIWRVLYTVCSFFQTEYDGTQTSEYHDRQLIVDGEIPWLAGWLFGGIEEFKPLTVSGKAWLQQQVEMLTDTDGMPSADVLERLALWLAPFVRCQVWADSFETAVWKSKHQQRFDQLIEVTASLCRPDRRLALSNGYADDVLPMLMSAIDQGELGTKSLPARYLKAISSRKGKKGETTTKKMGVAGHHKKRIKKSERPAVQSDWSQIACLRNAWSETPDLAVVAHHGTFPLLELTALGKTVFSGSWQSSINLDGKPVKWNDGWCCVCWHSDSDADYLELQSRPEDKCQVTRQVVLSRNDQFAFIADVVKADEGVRVDYESTLPIAGDWKTSTDETTRACYLKADDRRVRVLPLFLPQQTVDGVAGECRFQDQTLTSKRSALGGVYAPLFVDWSPGRQRSYVDWRSLTVSELGQPVHSSEGAGYRCRLGNRQWVIYRNLGSSEEFRTILGHHTNCETVVGEFSSDGDVEPLLIVE